MKTTKDMVPSGAEKRKLEKIISSAGPFLLMAGLISKKRKASDLKSLKLQLGHKTALLPNRKIKGTNSIRRGVRYIIVKGNSPIATVDLLPTRKGIRAHCHVTYGPTIAPLYNNLLWLTTEYNVLSNKITAMKVPYLGKNYLSIKGQKPAMLFEVGDNPPTKLTSRQFLSLYNKTVGFLLKEHKKFKKALNVKLKKEKLRDESRKT